MLACLVANKHGKPVMAFAGNNQCPTIFVAECAQIIYVFALKGFVIFARVATCGKGVMKILFKFV
jgi:hypothetical protein